MDIKGKLREGLKNYVLEGRFDILTKRIIDLVWGAIKHSKKDEDDDAEYHFGTVGESPNVDLWVYVTRTDSDDWAYEARGQTTLGTNIMEIIIDIEAPSFDIEHILYTDINAELHSAVRHELEHIVQQKGKNYIQGRAKPISAKERGKVEGTVGYFLSRDEIPAMVAGFYKKAKHQKRPFDEVVDEFLEYFTGEDLENEDVMITPEEKEKVLNVYIDYAKKHYPSVKLSK